MGFFGRPGSSDSDLFGDIGMKFSYYWGGFLLGPTIGNQLGNILVCGIRFRGF